MHGVDLVVSFVPLIYVAALPTPLLILRIVILIAVYKLIIWRATWAYNAPRKCVWTELCQGASNAEKRVCDCFIQGRELREN